jgi:hypothetical protein
MELIYATMFMTNTHISLLKKEVGTTNLVTKMVELIELCTLAQLIAPMQQWYEQVKTHYPEHFDHKVQVCSSNPKAVDKDMLARYRTYRAEAKKLKVPAHVFNCYLLQAVLTQAQAQPQAEPVAPVEE